MYTDADVGGRFFETIATVPDARETYTKTKVQWKQSESNFAEQTRRCQENVSSMIAV